MPLPNMPPPPADLVANWTQPAQGPALPPPMNVGPQAPPPGATGPMSLEAALAAANGGQKPPSTADFARDVQARVQAGGGTMPGAPAAPAGPDLSLARAGMGGGPTGAPAAPGAPGAGVPSPGIRMIPGGKTAAHEVDLRGPTLTRAEDRALTDSEEALQEAKRAGEEAAVVEKAVNFDRFNRAVADKETEERAAAKSAADLQAKEDDFRKTAAELSKEHVDPNRFWNSRTTGQQIMGLAGVALGGFLQGFKGGSNPAMDAMNQAIDRDVKAQEFAYQTKKDALGAKQSAYGMAMQRYGDSRAARALAHAAGIEAAQAQLGMAASEWKTADVQQRYAQAMDALNQKKVGYIQQGIRFMPSSQGEGMVYDPEIGVPVPVSEYRKYRVKGAEGNRETGQKAVLEGIKGDIELQKHGAERGDKTAQQDQASAQHLSDKIGEGKIPQLEQAVSDLEAMIPPTGDIKGVGFAANRLYEKSPLAFKTLYGDEASHLQQRFVGVKNSLYNILSGSAVGPKEEERLKAQLNGANDADSLREAAREIRGTIDATKKNFAAGATPGGRAMFEQRRKDIEGESAMPASARKAE